MKAPLFYAKILLFGEYGIIKNSKALSIPYNYYRGGLKVSKEESTINSHRKLIDFCDYLKIIPPSVVSFDWERLNKDLSKGMYFDSSIPQGYGIGSSGALVASIYDQYALNKITILENLTKEKLLRLKVIFAEMESFFHGKSSGLDPLNSYLSLPILVTSKSNIESTGIPSQNPKGKGAVFLLDSETVSETAPMVSIFMNNMKQEPFRKMMKDKFINYTDACIDDFLNGNLNSLLTNIKQLSDLVFHNFKPMIPERLHKIWKQGIESNNYYLKLCGSGGGGYILGFTENFSKTKKILKDYKLEVVYNF